jgi:ferredoxin
VYTIRKGDDVTVPAVINKSKCDGCEICVDECASQAIIMINKLPVIDIEKCVECETCVDLCPSEAVSIKEVKNAIVR